MKESGNRTLQKISRSLIPMSFGGVVHTKPKDGVVLAADIGGTKTNLALLQIKNGRFTVLKEDKFQTEEHESILEIIDSFHEKHLPGIDNVCLGIAGPIIDWKVEGTNFPWEIDGDKIAAELKIDSVHLINDMEANAYGLAGLEEKDFYILRQGTNSKGNAAIISPGTGLGEAGMYWDGTHYHPFATEGGHCDFAPDTDLDVALWNYLKTKFDHVSWEKVASGQGIDNIYEFLIGYRNHVEPKWLKERFLTEDSSEVITEVAMEGKDALCVETLVLFLEYLAREAAQLGLKFKAQGGIYIGGGIAPNITRFIDKEVFSNTFLQVGRMNALLETMPIKVVLNTKTALIGAAYYGAMVKDAL